MVQDDDVEIVLDGGLSSTDVESNSGKKKKKKRKRKISVSDGTEVSIVEVKLLIINRLVTL